jgi:8-oxo-dGTP pyrophosphatase MutT (NUDIX family)
MKFRDWHNNQIDLPSERTFSWRPSAYAFLVNDGKILCVKSALHDYWELPGGGVELGETPVQALHREVVEETGYQVEALDETPILMKNDFFYAPDLDEYFQSLLMVFRARLVNHVQQHGKIDSYEIAQVRWIGFDELDNYEFHPFIDPLLLRARSLS